MIVGINTPQVMIVSCLSAWQIINCAAVGGRSSCWASGLFIFLVLLVTRPELPLGQMLSLDDVTISLLQAISQLFSSYPPSGEFCQVSELTIQKKKMASGRGEMFILSKLGQNPSEMDVRTFARINNVIWDKLLATKAEIIQS